MRKLHILILPFLFLLQSVSGQDDVSFTRYSQEEGLTAVTFREIMEDGQGFVWIVTEQGVNRFDGYAFRSFKHDPSDPNTIADSKPNILICDSSRNPIFISEKYLSVYQTEEQRFRNYKLPEALIPDGVNQKVRPPRFDYLHNLCWFLENNNLISFDPVSGKFSFIPLPRDKPDYHYLFVMYDYIFLMHEQQPVKMFAYDIRQKKFIDFSYPDNSVGGGLETRDYHFPYDNYPGAAKAMFTGEHFVIFNEADPLHPKLYTPKHSPGTYKYFRASLIGNNEVWVGTPQGKILRINYETGEEEEFDINVNHIPNRIDNPIYSIVQDDEGEVWATTDGLGLIRINPATGNITQYVNIPGNPNSIWSNSTSYVLKHSSGVLLVTSISKGLVKIEKQKKIFRTYVPINEAALAGKMLSVDVRAVLALDSTHLLTGTLTNLCVIDKITGVTDFVRNNHSTTVVPELSEGGNYTAFVRMKDGTIIIGTWNGKYFAYNPETNFFKEYSLRTGFDFHPIGWQTRSMLLDSKNNLWLATESGLSVISVDSFITATPNTLHFKTISAGIGKANCITGFPAYSLFEDDKKNIWAGTGYGLNKIAADGSVTQFVNDPENLNSLSEDNVRCVTQDAEGNIWVATNGGGVNKYETATGKFTSYSLQNGLPDDAIYAILFDDNQNLWISCNRGLAKLDIKTGNVVKYTPHDGLQNYEYNTNAYCKMPGGELVFGGTSGLNIFIPSDIRVSSSIPKIALCSFRLFNKEIPLSENGLTLNHDKNNFTFEFAAMSFYRNSENQYAYKMEGIDPDWIFDNRRLITYNNIPPGNYVFKIKGSNSSGVWNEAGISFPLIILPPWWQTWWAIIGAIALVISGIILFVRFRTKSLRRQQAILEQKVNERTRELKASQQQLVQQEKLASLGQLTAGIAHEIKNPLNFVNNFSDISAELIEEYKMSTDENEKKQLLEDLRINLQKISDHGKRADSIVKNMLQHSRGVTGLKEPTDIVELAEEYLNLSYHGMRATLQSFNCRVTKDFSADIPLASVIPQDISRVLLNLFNNAFYAVHERAKTAGADYFPEVIVSVKKEGNYLFIRVRDNGTGIPDHVAEKIFEPFFTTKPTGEGTGLGLSISYDIIKAHKGEMTVDSKPDQYTLFTIKLPVT